MGRREVRENVLKLVYELVVCGQTSELSVEEASKVKGDPSLSEADDSVFNVLDKDGKKYFDRAYFGIVKHRGELEDTIKRYARAYDYNRLYKVDTAILLMAVYELLYMDDIPYKVTVNEAVELAKAYSTERSAAYINGILASVIKNTEANK